LEARESLAAAGAQQSRGGSGLNRWRQIEELYNAARELDPGARALYLQEACPDKELRGEVESLLGCDAEAEDFLESPALEIAAEALAEGRTRSMVGRVLGPYQIVSFLGAGGMGEVYRARDSRIGRDVAIKVLPPGIAADPARLQRFEQEARATGALNHPNILAIHDIGFEDGAPYVVYELLEGETLRQRLRHGSLPRRKALDHARQIALGLAAAHEKSITHRDLKPENLFLTRDGRVKILDFGLAKLSPPGRSVPVHNISLSQTDAASTPGTPGYMAPEQVRAGTVDHRSDLFNLGAILCEMLTGSAPFRGRSTGEVLSSILKDDPVEAMETGENFDPGLSRLLRRCLEKDPNERIQSARDLAFDIETLLLAPARARQPGRQKPVALLALAAVVFVLPLSSPAASWGAHKRTLLRPFIVCLTAPV
jgi:serine/threonine protein kinase